MDFFKQNGRKIIRDAILTFVITEVIVTFFALAGYVYYKNHGGYTRPISVPVLFSLAMSLFVTVMSILSSIVRGLYLQYKIKKILTDTSDKSIMPLFDDYSIELSNEKSKNFFTKEFLKGHIAGLPVVFEYHMHTRHSRPYFFFDFKVAKGGYLKLEDRIESRLTYNVNVFTGRLDRDIKPEVLKQAKLLKENGYLPVNE